MMTNREYMIGLLSSSGFVDDGGASYEAMVYYNVNCPYYAGDERGHCSADGKIKRENCFPCKEEWLRGDDDERHDRAFVWNIMCLIWTHDHITDKPATDKRCVETDCYYNNNCVCTAPPIFAVNTTAGKECFNYSED